MLLVLLQSISLRTSSNQHSNFANCCKLRLDSFPKFQRNQVHFNESKAFNHRNLISAIVSSTWIGFGGNTISVGLDLPPHLRLRKKITWNNTSSRCRCFKARASPNSWCAFTRVLVISSAAAAVLAWLVTQALGLVDLHSASPKGLLWRP